MKNIDNLLILNCPLKKMSYNLTFENYARALYYSLCEDPFYATIESSIENQNTAKTAMFKYMDYSMLEAQNYGMLYLPDDHEFGASVWLKPLSSELEKKKKEEKKKFLLDELGRQAYDTYQAIVDYMSAKAEPLIKSDFWYLSIIGIIPQFQGQGYGFKLVREVLSITDKLQIPTYLETFASRTIAFYNRLGFQVIVSFTEKTIKTNYYLMTRDF